MKLERCPCCRSTDFANEPEDLYHCHNCGNFWPVPDHTWDGEMETPDEPNDCSHEELTGLDIGDQE